MPNAIAKVSAAEWQALISQARKTNAERDKIDRDSRSAPPGDGGLWPLILTVMAAIEAGVRTADIRCLAEASAMLEEVLPRAKALEDRERLQQAGAKHSRMTGDPVFDFWFLPDGRKASEEEALAWLAERKGRKP
jgi:hypothetical protein